MNLLGGFTLVLSAAACLAAYDHLQWSTCGGSGVTLNKIEVSPMPVVVPGDFQLTIQGSLDRQLGDISIDLDIKRHTFLLDIPIPCLFHVGSCTYENTCTSSLLDTMVKEDWAGLMANIGTQIDNMLTTSMPNVTDSSCPYPPMPINIDHFTFHVPEIPAVLSWFAEGDYGVKATVTDKNSGDTILCLHLDMTIKEPCTGLFCGR